VNVDEFTRSRRAAWQALSDLLDRSQSSITTLTPDEIRKMGVLYKAVTSDLALAQRDFPNARVTTYLNQLVGRAHATLYQSKSISMRQVFGFITHGFPRAFRAMFPFTLVAFLLFMAPAVAAGLLVGFQEEAVMWMLTPSTQGLIPIVEGGELWIDIPPSQSPAVSSFITTNNIQVSFIAFAGGILGGVFTVYIMILNGLQVGALLGFTSHYQLANDLLNFMIAHGVVELSVIFMAGGSGLMLGWALLAPGMQSRSDALTEAAKRAVRILVGCVPLLIFTGVVEGFISDSDIPTLLKWWVGVGSGIIFYAYVLLAGRSAPPTSDRAPSIQGSDQ
jgi:uncharacterized membrane protein SpoIIM required for sporulation